MEGMNLQALVIYLRHSLGVVHKQDIQAAARRFRNWCFPDLIGSSSAQPILLGDDCAAIPDGDGYLLLAAEGMWPLLVETEPWFAGWCAVMVNISDIYAMGGRPLALVDVVWHQAEHDQIALWQGMRAAALTYQVPIVGGHTNGHSPYDALAVAILGRATHLISSFQAQPDDRLLMVVDLRGELHPHYPFWNATADAPPERLREDLDLLPRLAADGLCDAGKDISMGGVVGTLLMLLETSGWGAHLDLTAIACPAGVPLETWLLCFPSYGFLLSLRPARVAAVQQHFQAQGLTCAVVGTVEAHHQVYVMAGSQAALLWDFTQEALTGFGPGSTAD